MTAALFSTTASVTAQQLYGPYSGVRYSNGSMPTATGHMGHRLDAATELDYYAALHSEE